MGFTLSKRSQERLNTCDKRLIDLVETAIKTSPVDFTVVCGHRTMMEQNLAVANGASKVQWPNSKHNSYPSNAVDLAPFINGQIAWNDMKAFAQLRAHILKTAFELGISVRHGADWNNNGIVEGGRDSWDWPHWELT